MGPGFRRDDDGYGDALMSCSAIGPSASAGRNVSAPMTITVDASSTTKSGVCVGSVPAEGGTCFFAASEPAIASIPIASGKRAKNIETPSSVFQNGVFDESPANALPLLFDADESA